MEILKKLPFVRLKNNSGNVYGLFNKNSDKTVVIIDGYNNKVKDFSNNNQLIFFQHEVEKQENACIDIIKKYFESPDLKYINLKNINYEIRELHELSANNFLYFNDYKGIIKNPYKCYGLYNNDLVFNRLIAVMCFSKPRRNMGKKDNDTELELVRFCTQTGVVIDNYAQIMFEWFKQNKPENIKQIYGYVSLMNKYGLKEYNDICKLPNTHSLIEIIPENYYYLNTKENIIENRWKYRKDQLVKKYGCSKDDTEKNFMENVMKFPRIYDKGNLKYTIML